jgi:hypothetical protein
MTPSTRMFAGVLFLLIITIELGGRFLLSLMQGKGPKISTTSTAYRLFRAGHAHAGVLVILALVSMPYIDQLTGATELQLAIRLCLTLAPLLMSAGFFAAGATVKDEKPGTPIVATYLGALVLAGGLGMLGVSLFRL